MEGDVSRSFPARYANILFIGYFQVVTAADAETGGWIRGLSRVVHLKMDTHGPRYAYYAPASAPIIYFRS